MNFVNSNDNTADCVEHVLDVLAFITQSLCWQNPSLPIELGDRSASGLYHILSACENTLQHVSARLRDTTE